MLSVYSWGCRERCYLYTAGGVGRGVICLQQGGVGRGVICLQHRGVGRGVICLQQGV